MVTVIRKPFIFMLVMLQFFAPLVHAHTGGNNYPKGLHIPGLESYQSNQNDTVFQNVNAAWDSEGLLVVVDTGIKNPNGIPVVDEQTGFALLPSVQFAFAVFPKAKNNFSPQSQPLRYRGDFSPHSPRAPPAQ
jgi:hypothetical protein